MRHVLQVALELQQASHVGVTHGRIEYHGQHLEFEEPRVELVRQKQRAQHPTTSQTLLERF